MSLCGWRTTLAMASRAPPSPHPARKAAQGVALVPQVGRVHVPSHGWFVAKLLLALLLAQTASFRFLQCVSHLSPTIPAEGTSDPHKLSLVQASPDSCRNSHPCWVSPGGLRVVSDLGSADHSGAWDLVLSFVDTSTLCQNVGFEYSEPHGLRASLPCKPL